MNKFVKLENPDERDRFLKRPKLVHSRRER